jgi:thymidylate synthase
MVNVHDVEYLRAVRCILDQGAWKESRTGVCTKSITGLQMRFNLQQGFPRLTSKHVSARNVAIELQWFLRGETNIKFLQDRRVHIWDDDGSKAQARGFNYPEGELGPVYGHQWRSWSNADGKDHDQITNLLTQLKTNSESRRMVVSAWNVGELSYMVLPPCHLLFQVICSSDDALDLVLTMRSGDMGLGLPYNIMSYALLLSLLARETNKRARELIINVGDAHIYENHQEALKAQLERPMYPPAAFYIPPEIKTLDDFAAIDDLNAAKWFTSYQSAGPLPMPLNT